MREARRGLGLIRVSKERDGMTSPEIQRHAIEEYARANNITIIEWVEGIDESGSRARSAWWPRLDQSIDRLEAGEIDTIIVWKFSRTSRHRLKWAVALDRVDRLGGGLVSATEPIDTATSHGRLARGMVGEFNAYQADLISDTWQEAHARRFREGKPINGKPRFGYAYDTDTKTFYPDPLTGKVLTDCYRRYIAGESVYALVRWLNEGATRPVSGYGVKTDGLWSARTLRRVLDSGFAAGFITYKGETKRGVHEPLISPAEWDAYREARERRRTYRRSERSPRVFSGMVWCACGSKMHGNTRGENRGGRAPAFYRCKDGWEKGKHTGMSVDEPVLETAVEQWLRERATEVAASTRKALNKSATPTPADPTVELKRRISALASKQVDLAERVVELGIPKDAYETLRDRYSAEREALEQELRSATVRQAAPVVVLPELLERWDDLEIPEKREYLRSLIAKIIVTPGRPVARVEIVTHT